MMQKKFKIVIRDETGAAAIPALPLILVVLALLMLFISVMPIFITKMQLDRYTASMVQLAEIQGSIAGLESASDDYLAQVGLEDVTISWSGTQTIDGSHVQLDDEIVFRAVKEETLNFGNISDAFPISVPSTTIGYSEVYHK
jgi:hypothetical protein